MKKTTPKEWGEGEYKVCYDALREMFAKDGQHDLFGKISMMVADVGADRAYEFIKPHALKTLPPEVCEILFYVHRHIEFLQNQPTK